MRLIVCMCLLLQGCVTMVATNMGAGAAVVATAETVDQVKTAADVVSYGTTSKTLTDHALDSVTGRDCNLIHVFNKYRKVCRERMPDLSTKEKIRAFQKSKGLEQTGRIGPLTSIAIWRIKNELD
jgi:hypothetical protein